MADVHEPAVRSYNMSQIKGKNTRPEVFVRKFLHRSGLRFRIHSRSLPGKPDIVLKKYKTAILVHGCFWHGHEGCKYFVKPKTNTQFWLTKIEQNKARDREAIKNLTQAGWKVIEIWECEIKSYNSGKFLNRIVKTITK
jgi:DNA mismatch endonuclease, patch repair protein